ncbi:MAG: YebC/PmpR family DNA-binding transcriptional regulator [Gemmatimonadota bacterium]|nr:YebC/PmpR family DNA-binding transcriptional regulator [Gemmatimonadota bacterium]MDH3426878.1 YebC/PmpR family DNA-binding transcriptional regulator [Gemmatimonadota bacterium]
MAGHSKWSKIKRQKAADDKTKGRIFSKLGREITVAAREAGGDPTFNPRLRTAVAAAKAENMPSANIDRAIQRGTGALPGQSFEDVVYEGYGPGGAALYLECVTDNTNRTVAEVRHLIEKAGGNLGTSGSVAWMFDRKGQIFVDAVRFDEESVLECALSAGAEDFLTDDGMHVVLTTVQDFHKVQEALGEDDIEIAGAELAMFPTSTMLVEGRAAERLLRLVADLEDHDDVMKVYANFELDESVLEALGAE